MLDFTEKCLPSVDGVVLSDYAKGVLGQDATRSLIHMACAAGRPVLVGPKRDDFAKYAGAVLAHLAKAQERLDRYPVNLGSAEIVIIDDLAIVVEGSPA